MIEAVIFDLDGTLWDSAAPVVDAWNRVLEQEYPGVRPPITCEEEKGLMGLPMDELARRLFPNLPDEECQMILNACVIEENRYLEQHGAVLFPAVEETIQTLSERFRLMIVSNCQTGYIEAFLKAHCLGGYFCDFQCFGDNGFSKGDNIRLIMERNGIQEAVYTGDTQGDRDAAEIAGIPFIFARYGFGTVTNYDAVIDKPEDLLNVSLLR